MVAPDNLLLADSEALGCKVLSERVRNLYEVSPYADAAAFACIAVAVYGLDGVVAGNILVGWAIVQALVACAMVGMYLHYRSVRPAGSDLPRWERGFAAAAGAAGCGWGLFASALMPPQSVPHQMLVVFIVLSMILAGLGSMQASRLSFAWFALPAVAGLVLELLVRGGTLDLEMAALACVVSWLVLQAFLHMNRELVQMLTARFEKDVALEKVKPVRPVAADGEQARSPNADRFEAAMNASPAGMWDWDLSVDQLAFSPRFRELLGYADEAEFNREFSFGGHLHPDDLGRVQEVIQQQIDGKGIFDEMFRLRCRDGLYRWFLGRGQAQWNDAGKAVRFAGAIIDVTQLKVREEALRRAETLLKEALAQEQAILDTAIVGIAIFKDRIISRCNRRFARMFGYTEDELIGRSSRVLFPSDEEFVALGVRAGRALTEMGHYDEERTFVCKDGSEIWCFFAGQPIDRANPEPGEVWITEDISERKRAESDLRSSEVRLALAVRASDSGIWDWDLEHDAMFYSPRFRELLGYRDLSNDRFTTVFRFKDNLHPEDRERTLAAVSRALETSEPFNAVCRLRCADGSYRSFHARGQAQQDLKGKAARFAGSITDVTELREQEQALASARAQLAETHARLRDAVDCIPDSFALFDADDRLALCNRKYEQTFLDGRDFEEFAGRSFEDLVRDSIAKGEVIPPEFNGDPEAWLAERVRMHRHPGEREVLFQLGDGRWYQVRERRTRDGGIVGVRTDVTELKANEERTRHLAHHDPLTGLPNRRLLQDRMDHSFTLARRNRTLVGVLLVDLDKFKAINDRDGHRVGDEVLRAVAARLRTCVREADTVARHGGDEFVVLLPEIRQAQDARRVADKIIAGISAPVAIEGREYQIGASIGIAVYPRDARDSEALLRCADQAMYRVKQNGRSGVKFFSE